MKQAIPYLRQLLQGIYPAGEIQALVFLMLEKKYHLTKLDVCMGKDKTLSPEERQEWTDIAHRLAKKEPVQYVLGEADFYGRVFKVTPHTLIPRPETAELVDWIVTDHNRNACGKKILDIGTGSGCIALSLAGAMPGTKVEGWDFSDGALQTARENSTRLNIPVTFHQQDILADPLPALLFDLIVSNPPYITESERSDMDSNVLDWEPDTALFVPDTNPLLFYRAIARFALQALTPGGTLYFEINRAFGRETEAMLHTLGFTHTELRKDFFGNDRMMKAQR